MAEALPLPLDPSCRGYPKTDYGQCESDYGREQGDAEGAIPREACPDVVTKHQAKRWFAMAVGSFRIASRHLPEKRQTPGLSSPLAAARGAQIQ